MSTRVDNRIWGLITLVACIGLLAAAWFLGAQPFVAQAQASNDAKSAVDATNNSTRSTITALVAAEKNLPRLRAEADSLEQSIPFSVGGSSFIRAMTRLASDSGVTVSSIKLEDPVPYAAPTAKTAATAGPTETASASPAPSDSATPEPVDPALEAALPYSNPIVTPENLTVVPFSVEVAGAPENLLAFTKALQGGDRLALVTGVNYTAGTGSGEQEKPKIVLSGNLYVLHPKAGAATSAKG